jgi:hypothetical protein
MVNLPKGGRDFLPSLYMPDIRVTVNYSRIQSHPPVPENHIYLVPGLTKNTKNVLWSTEQIEVKEGSQSLAVLRTYVRQSFQSTFLATVASFLSVRKFQSNPRICQ